MAREPGGTSSVSARPVAEASPGCLHTIGVRSLAVGRMLLPGGQMLIDFNGAEISAWGSGPNRTSISKLSLERRRTKY